MSSPDDIPLVRVKFNVTWSSAPYYRGEIYDVPATEEVRQLILNGLADFIPYPTSDMVHNEGPEPGDAE